MFSPETRNQGKKCQKCLLQGHWTYECKGTQAYAHRPSRTAQLRKLELNKENTSQVEEHEAVEREGLADRLLAQQQQGRSD